MKRTLTALMIVAIAAPAAFALEPVELQEGCLESFGEFGISGEGLLWVGLLQELQLEEAEGASWNMPILGTPLDSETLSMDPEDFFVGDGIPDYVQCSLLAAAICSAEKDAAAVAAQFDANKALFVGFANALTAFFASIGDGTDGAMAQNMVAAGESLKALALVVDPSLSDPDILAMYGLGRVLSCDDDDVPDCDPEANEGTGQMLGEFVGEYLQLGTILLGVQNVFCMQVGMSTEGQLTAAGLLASLLEELEGYDTALLEVAAYCDGAALSITGLLAQNYADMVDGCGGEPNPTPPHYGFEPCETFAAEYFALEAMATPVAAQLAALADEIEAAVALMSALAVPAFDVYGVAKTAGEPFSAFGDYDGDGLSNLETYNNLQGAGMDSPEEFVAAASGAELWYPGSPALPVAGLLGLALLAGGAAVGGAFAIRKK